MEEFPSLESADATVGAYYCPPASSVTTTSAPAPPASAYGRNFFPAAATPISLQSSRVRGVEERGDTSAGEDIQDLKAKIMAHPRYSRLATAYLDCHKVGAPQDMVARLSATAGALESRYSCRQEPSFEPELDQFMEAYSDMLLKYGDELTRLFQDATDFIKQAESQLKSLIHTTSSLPLFTSADENNEAVVAISAEEEGDDSCGEIDPNAADKELKQQLLNKYSGCLGSLRQQLSKSKKKGKLPNEARHKLLNWWQLHYRWPYPSESEKVALAESTGLDHKQINNWFINQRKRHWKPTEETQCAVADGFRPQNDANLVLQQGRQLIGDGLHRFAC